MVNVFLFKHCLRGYKTPGRFPFIVEGRALRRIGSAYITEPSLRRIVYVDGYGANTPGPNIDPFVLSEVLPWILSFCNINKQDDEFLARPVGAFDAVSPRKILPKSVNVGDVIVFGDLLPRRIIAIDTVLCVGRQPVELPQDGGQFVLRSRFNAYWKQFGGAYGAMTWNQFKNLPEFKWNLADTLDKHETISELGYERPTSHHRARLPTHLQILGRRGETVGGAVDTLLSDFLGGRGFDFIPLADSPPHAMRGMRKVEEWPGLFIRPWDGAQAVHRAGRLKVARLDCGLGESLLRLIFEEARELVVGPLRWLQPTAPVTPPRRGSVASQLPKGRAKRGRRG
ncbi:uncharacterized protein SOCEGT47_075810 [Sorangium cellulosum]|uniref:Uncharacterized protein n=1 Tax=Sorangium cellulosum TaxID=56 RepID=A0A4P2QCF4_SORCE|nr:hypothetical protein [Sorangium cellulosum]AUX27008.1 uncharacterized protein SOCEGT47_075810 [Sorangium cellulosum]